MMAELSPVGETAKSCAGPSAVGPCRSGRMVSEPTVFVVDSDPAACKAVRDLVNTMNLPCEVYSSGQDFLDAYDSSRPGCLVMELRVPGVSGLEIQRRLKSEGILLPVIFLTAHADLSIAVEAMRSGAIHFLEKPFRTLELWGAIQEAIELDQQRRQAVASHAQLNRRLATLNSKERSVLEMLAEGKSSKEIAAVMETSVRTVEGHRARLMQKLGVSSLSELIAIAILAAGGEDNHLAPGDIEWSEE